MKMLGRSWRAVVLGYLAVWGAGVSPLGAQERAVPRASEGRAAEMSGLQALLALEETMTRVIAESEKSVVSIARVKRDPEALPRNAPLEFFPPFAQRPRTEAPPDSPDFIPQEFATGVIIDAAGLVLTNYHVYDEQSDLWVTTTERKIYRTKLRGGDKRADLLVLEIVGAGAESTFTPIRFGDAKALKKGQIVIALGNPYAIARDGQPSASWGIVSNLSRKVSQQQVAETDLTLHHLGTLIQTDAKLNLGTSGGALLNLKGEMVGLTTSVAAVSGFEQAAGYAIPVDDAFRRIINELKQGRSVAYGFLGVRPASLTAREFGAGRPGVRVEEVSPGTPARRAGLQVGDLITHINGAPIFDSDGMRLEVGKLPAGAEATLTIQRGGAVDFKRVMLAKFPKRTREIVTAREPDWRGLRVDFSSAVIDRLQFDDAAGDMVAISEVADDSPAHKAGLRPQMLVSHVGNNPVRTPAEFYEQAASRTGPVVVRVQVNHLENRMFLVEP